MKLFVIFNDLVEKMPCGLIVDNLPIIIPTRKTCLYDPL
jgi:hypothetical protein